MLFLRYIGITPLYGILMVVVPFYMLFAARNRKAISAYLMRMGYAGRWRRFCAVYRNHYYFAQAMVDRFALFVGLEGRYRVRITGNEALIEAINRPQGAILAGAHAGNMELAGYFFDHSQKVFNGIVFGAEAKFLNRQREQILSRHQVNLIPVAADMSHVVLLHQALKRGEFVTLYGDRSLLGNKRTQTSFLGAPAFFPIGAFQLAVRMDVPVWTLFMMREKSRHYHIIVREIDRKSKAEDYVAAYASVLEEVLRAYPEQWYNYYDFWKC